MLFRIKKDTKENMKGTKTSFFLLFSSYLLLFAALFLSRNMYDKTSELQGSASFHKVTICTENNGNDAGNNLFNSRDIEKLSGQLNTDTICYSIQTCSLVSYGDTTIMVGITATNELAPVFNDIKIIKGSFFSKGDIRESNKVVVIEERMAWDLFHNDDVVGCYIKLFGSRFKIIGIAASDQSFFTGIVDNGTMQAYIPVETYMNYSANSGITCIQYGTDSGSAYEDNTKQITNALASISRKGGSYSVCDYNIKGIMMKQKPDSLLFVMGLFTILAISIFSLKKCCRTIKLFANMCKTNYFGKSIRACRIELSKDLGLLITAALIIILIWKLIRFEPYIPYNLLPDNLSDLTPYIQRLIQQAMNRNLLNNSHLVPFPELMSMCVEAIHQQMFWFGCVSGSLLLLISFAWVRKEKAPIEKTLLYSGIFLVMDIVIVALLSYAVGLPPSIDLYEIIVFLTFIFTGLLVARFNARTLKLMERNDYQYAEEDNTSIINTSVRY